MAWYLPLRCEVFVSFAPPPKALAECLRLSEKLEGRSCCAQWLRVATCSYDWKLLEVRDQVDLSGSHTQPSAQPLLADK